jgi:hypothetical protein
MTRQRILALVLVSASLSAPASQAQRADLNVRLEATLLLSAFRNDGRVNNADVPTIALVPDQSPLGAKALGASIRQTRVRALGQLDSALGGTVLAEIDVDFFGGQQPSGGGRTHPLLRIRRAFVGIDWPRGSLLIGQEAPPLFEINPSSLSGVGFPLFASAGNLWLWLPQVRATGWLVAREGIEIGLEGTLLAPNAGEPVDPFLTQPDRAELADRPAVEGRALARWGTGAGQRLGQLTIGGHAGWLRNGDGGLVRSRAFGMGAMVPLGRMVELRGEYFDGRALAGLGGGGIGQNLTTDGGPVRTRGGWIQGIVAPTRTVELALGFGIDDPDDRDEAAAGRRRNRVVAVALTWRPAPLVIGAEVRRFATGYRLPTAITAKATHLVLSLGAEF